MQQEVVIRLHALKPRCVWVPIPNGFWIPTRSAAEVGEEEARKERELAGRLVAQMKRNGQLHEGAFDLGFWWENNGGAGIELKAPPTHTLLGTTPRGRLSANQRTFRDWCLEMGVEYRVCEDWAGVLAALKEWGRI